MSSGNNPESENTEDGVSRDVTPLGETSCMNADMPLLTSEPATVVDLAAFRAARQADRRPAEREWPSWLKRPAPTSRAIAHRERMLRHLVAVRAES